MKTVVVNPQATPLFPKVALLVNQISGSTYDLSFRRTYRMGADADVQARAGRAIFMHAVSISVTEALLVVAPRIKLLRPSSHGCGSEYAKIFRKRARLQLLVDDEEILKDCPLNFAHDGTGPLANPPIVLYYGAEAAGEKWEPKMGRRLGLFLPNGSVVSMRVEGVPSRRGGVRLHVGLEAAVYV